MAFVTHCSTWKKSNDGYDLSWISHLLFNMQCSCMSSNVDLDHLLVLCVADDNAPQYQDVLQFCYMSHNRKAVRGKRS